MPFLSGIAFKSFGKRPFRLKKIKAIVSATGGTISTPGNGFRYHTFTGPGTFYVSDGSGPFEILVVGGGGASGGPNGGGGGGGGVRYVTNIPTSPGTSHPISVGAGGGYAPPIPSSGLASTFGHPGGPYVSLGGGRGGIYSGDANAIPGGCGGGGNGYYSGLFAPGGAGSAQYTGPSSFPFSPGTYTPAPFQGYPGGQSSGSAPAYGAGGGGGAGGSGSPGTTGGGGPGGSGSYQANFLAPLIGVPTLSPLSGRFAAGGGASPTSPGAGGGSPGLGTGVANSGGGGGSSSSGYSGIIVVRYQYEV